MQEEYTSIKLYADCSQHFSIKFAAKIAVPLSLSLFHVVLFSEHTDINPTYSFQCTEKCTGKSVLFLCKCGKKCQKYS